MTPSGQAGGRAAAQAVSAVARPALARRRRSERPFARDADPAVCRGRPCLQHPALHRLRRGRSVFHQRHILPAGFSIRTTAEPVPKVMGATPLVAMRASRTTPRNPLGSEHAAPRHTRSDAPACTGTRELTRVKIFRRSYRPPSRELEDHLHPFARTSRQFANRIVTTPSRALLLVRSVLCLFVPEGTGKTGRKRRSRQRIKHVLSVSTRRTVFIPTRKGEEAPRLAPAVDTNEH